MPTKEKSASTRSSSSASTADRIRKAMAKKGKEMNRALRNTGQQIQLKGRQLRDNLRQNGNLKKAVAPTVVAAAALAIGGTVAALQKRKSGRSGGSAKSSQTESSTRSKSRTRRSASSRTGQRTTRSAA